MGRARGRDRADGTRLRHLRSFASARKPCSADISESRALVYARRHPGGQASNGRLEVNLPESLTKQGTTLAIKPLNLHALPLDEHWHDFIMGCPTISHVNFDLMAGPSPITDWFADKDEWAMMPDVWQLFCSLVVGTWRSDDIIYGQT